MDKNYCLPVFKDIVILEKSGFNRHLLNAGHNFEICIYTNLVKLFSFQATVRHDFVSVYT